MGFLQVQPPNQTALRGTLMYVRPCTTWQEAWLAGLQPRNQTALRGTIMHVQLCTPWQEAWLHETAATSGLAVLKCTCDSNGRYSRRHVCESLRQHVPMDTDINLRHAKKLWHTLHTFWHVHFHRTAA